MKGRKLRPLVRPRPPEDFKTRKEVKIQVHVIKAENVPIRYEMIEQYEKAKNRGASSMGRPTAVRPNQGFGDNDPNDYNEERSFEDERPGVQAVDARTLDTQPHVETYVEVRLHYYAGQTIVKFTNTDEGIMPRWNQILEFPLHAANDEKFTLSELANTEAFLTASIFDKQEYLSQREGAKVIQEEHRFLGEVTIPLSTILTNPDKIDFNFKVNRPVCMPGYRVLDNEIHTMSYQQLANQVELQETQPPTTLNLSISLEPGISLPNENSQTYYPGPLDTNQLENMGAWITQQRKAGQIRFKHFPTMEIFGLGVDGYSVFIPRYLTA